VTAVAATAAFGHAGLTESVEQILEFLDTCMRGRVEVVGDGPLAETLRDRVGTGDGAKQARAPTVIIDTTGSPERIRDALRRLNDLGTLVLAHEVSGGDVSMNLYADLHLRCLTIKVCASETG
jgi:hypothetical protein